MQLYVKDQSNKDSNLYVLFVGKPDDTRKFIPTNVGIKYPSKAVFEELEKIRRIITKPWVVLDLEVVRDTSVEFPVFYVNETVLKFNPS